MEHNTNRIHPIDILVKSDNFHGNKLATQSNQSTTQIYGSRWFSNQINLMDSW